MGGRVWFRVPGEGSGIKLIQIPFPKEHAGVGGDLGSFPRQRDWGGWGLAVMSLYLYIYNCFALDVFSIMESGVHTRFTEDGVDQAFFPAVS